MRNSEVTRGSKGPYLVEVYIYINSLIIGYSARLEAVHREIGRHSRIEYLVKSLAEKEDFTMLSTTPNPEQFHVFFLRRVNLSLYSSNILTLY